MIDQFPLQKSNVVASEVESLLTMGDARQVIALAGVGDLGRYVCEELHASPDFDVIVLTRAVSNFPSSSAKESVSFLHAVIHNGPFPDVCSIHNRNGSRANKSAPSRQITLLPLS